jgi:hypothetical protein
VPHENRGHANKNGKPKGSENWPRKSERKLTAYPKIQISYIASLINKSKVKK